jgi:hypothetical protein
MQQFLSIVSKCTKSYCYWAVRGRNVRRKPQTTLLGRNCLWCGSLFSDFPKVLALVEFRNIHNLCFFQILWIFRNFEISKFRKDPNKSHFSTFLILIFIQNQKLWYSIQISILKRERINILIKRNNKRINTSMVGSFEENTTQTKTWEKRTRFVFQNASIPTCLFLP